MFVCVCVCVCAFGHGLRGIVQNCRCSSKTSITPPLLILKLKFKCILKRRKVISDEEQKIRILMMLGDGTATISTLKPVCVHVNALRWCNHNPHLEHVCVCVYVLSCQFLEVEQWVKGHSAQL